MKTTNEEKPPTRAGLLAFNLSGQVLLVTTLGSKTQWCFPKGHIEPGETPDRTAVRECYEETGIVATSLSKIGTSSYTLLRGTEEEEVIIEWWSGFAVRKVLQDPSDSPLGFVETDFRDSKWVSVDEALELLSFENLKTILRKSLCWD